LIWVQRAAGVGSERYEWHLMDTVRALPNTVTAACGASFRRDPWAPEHDDPPHDVRCEDCHAVATGVDIGAD
jgi:hypothetical protein